MLARSQLKFLMLIDLIVYKIVSTVNMELCPFQVFSMLCADTRVLCNCSMLALVVQTFSHFLIIGERLCLFES